MAAMNRKSCLFALHSCSSIINGAKAQCRHFRISKHKFTVTNAQMLKKYFDPEVEQILMMLTGSGEKHMQRYRVASKTTHVKYKLLSDEELEKEVQHAQTLQHTYTRMIPYMAAKKLPAEPLQRDPDIAPALNSKFVFVDISQESKRLPYNHMRTVVVRHENGDLRHADAETADRMMRVYLPSPGQQVVPPKVFEPDVLEGLLCPEKYVYLLEMVCNQYSPDNPEFVRVTHTIYNHVASNMAFSALESTPYLGPLVFHLAVNNRLEQLLVYYIENERLAEMKAVIHLTQIIHGQPVSQGSVFSVVQQYVRGEVDKAYSVIQTSSTASPTTRTPEEQKAFEEKISNLELLQNALKHYTRREQGNSRGAR